MPRSTILVHDPGSKPGFVEFQSCAFPHLRDKRMSELTVEQRADAREDWIRANHAYARDPENIAFLLARIDALRTQVNLTSVLIRHGED